MENKVIFESEEELKEFLNNFYCASTDREKGIESTFENIKRAGLSGKSSIEEAEEILKKEIETSDYQYRIDDCKKILQAIQELKSEIEKLKSYNQLGIDLTLQNQKLESEKAELINALQTVNKKIEEFEFYFELYNELSIDLLYTNIENLLIKHKKR